MHDHDNSQDTADTRLTLPYARRIVLALLNAGEVPHGL